MSTLATINWLFICGLSFCLGGVVILSWMPIASDCICPFSRNKPSADIDSMLLKPERLIREKSMNEESSSTASSTSSSSSALKSVHKLAILVPFRDRFEELLQFVPHLTKFLQKQNIDHHIFVLNQIDRFRFNRASLINVGFRFSSGVYDYIAMHDVDLLPLNDDLRYDYPGDDGPLHIASPKLHPRYHYETFVGGILLIRREHFQRVNGMSNKYWGWGLEDDEFYVRLKDAGFNVLRPQNIKTGINDTFNHIHNRYHRKRDTQKCFNQKEVTQRRDHQTGLNTLQYSITKVHEATIDGIRFTILNIKLTCDMKQTPWCDCSGNTERNSM